MPHTRTCAHLCPPADAHAPHPTTQAAVMAAEEASAAVNSSGPHEDAFAYATTEAATLTGGAPPAPPSPREAPTHWRGVLDEHPRAPRPASASLQGQQGRPSTAPAAVAYSRHPFATSELGAEEGKG